MVKDLKVKSLQKKKENIALTDPNMVFTKKDCIISEKRKTLCMGESAAEKNGNKFCLSSLIFQASQAL